MNSNLYSAEGLCKNGILGQVMESKSYRFLELELLDDFLKTLRFRNYNEVDWLLSRISQVFGPRYADALYQLVREHKYGNAREVEIRALELIVELQDSEQRSRRDPFQRIYRHYWRNLTPNSITPIDAPERTRELSFDIKNNSAMPGVGESMRFAARLGIGRYVPCFVFFTDVGQLYVDVFPVGQLSADKIYEQLRIWIDSFYEKNSASIDKWNQVEKDIVAFTNSVNQPLTKLQNWITQSEELWNELRLIAQVIVKLNAFVSNPEVYKPIIDDIYNRLSNHALNNSSGESRQILLKCLTRLKELYTQRENYKLHQESLKTIINNLNVVSDFAQVYDELSRAVKKPLMRSALSILEQAIRLIEQQHHKAFSLSFIQQLFSWWGLVQRSIPSFKKFKIIHKKLKFPPQSSNEVVRAEYTKFIKNIFELPFSDTPETLIKKVQPLLANIIGVDSDSQEWKISFSKYSNQLMPFFSQLHDKTPQWITKDGSKLKISDVIIFQNRDSVNFVEILAKTKEEHPLRCLIQKNISVEQKNQQSIIVTEIEKIALQCRDEVVTAFTKLQEQQLDAAYADCFRDIYDLRDKIEKKLTDIANSASHPKSSLRLVETKDIAGFLSLLDEYSRTVNSLVHPYKSNRSVENIQLSASLTQIFKLSILEQLNPSDQRRKKLEEELEGTVHKSKAGVRLLEDFQKRSCTMTPLARLESELKKIMYDFREVTDNTEQILGMTVEQLKQKLYELNDEELQNLCNSMAASTVKLSSKEEIIDTIFAIVGLIPTKEHQGIRSHELDNELKNTEIAISCQQNTDKPESITIQANIQIINNLEAKAVAESQSNPNTFNNDLREAKIGNFANQVQDNAHQQINRYNYASPEKQTLAEAANEIQRLLKQLEETNPTATEIEQVTYVSVAVKSDIRQRAVAALKAGCETAIDEFFLENKYLKVGKAVIKAWLKPNS
jgi:hypothetical protein